ncbi:outer membrane lipoprotein carrier protein LolA [Candidatus Margulisiibacteriota bacterium]
MHKKIQILLLISIFLITSIFPCNASEVSDLIKKIQEAQPQYADLETKVEINTISPLLGDKSIKQVQKIYRKGKDKERIDVIEPIKQTTIINGKYLYQKDAQGRVIKQDLEEVTSKALGFSYSPDRIENIMKAFELTASQNADSVVLTGIPKELAADALITKVVMTFTKDTLLLNRIQAYRNQELLMTSEMNHTLVNEQPVLKELNTQIFMEGMPLSSQAVYSEIKLDQGLADSLFEVDEQ